MWYLHSIDQSVVQLDTTAASRSLEKSLGKCKDRRISPSRDCVDSRRLQRILSVNDL